VTIATPAVFTVANHGFVAGSAVRFTTTGALPTGIVSDTIYFVISAGLTTNTFQVSATSGGSAVATSGSQAGVHSVDYVRLLTAQEKSKFDQRKCYKQGIIDKALMVLRELSRLIQLLLQ
jgi:hypothetical protein